MKGQEIDIFVPDLSKRWALDKSHGNTFSKSDPCLGYLRAVKTNFADEAMPKPCGHFFAENHVAEPFLTNTEEDVACSVALLPSTREHRSTFAFIHKMFFRFN